MVRVRHAAVASAVVLAALVLLSAATHVSATCLTNVCPGSALLCYPVEPPAASSSWQGVMADDAGVGGEIGAGTGNPDSSDHYCFGCPQGAYQDQRYVVTAPSPPTDEHWLIGQLSVGTNAEGYECTGGGATQCQDFTQYCSTPTATLVIHERTKWSADNNNVYANARLELAGVHETVNPGCVMRLHDNAHLVIGSADTATTLDEVHLGCTTGSRPYVSIPPNAVVDWDLKLGQDVNCGDQATLEVGAGSDVTITSGLSLRLRRLLVHGGSSLEYGSSSTPIICNHGGGGVAAEFRGTTGEDVFLDAELTLNGPDSSMVVDLNGGTLTVQHNINGLNGRILRIINSHVEVLGSAKLNSDSRLEMSGDAVLRVESPDSASMHIGTNSKVVGRIAFDSTTLYKLEFDSGAVIDLVDAVTGYGGALQLTDPTYDCELNIPNSSAFELRLHMSGPYGRNGMSRLHISSCDEWVTGTASRTINLDIRYDGGADPDTFQHEYSAEILRSDSGPFTSTGAVHVYSYLPTTECDPIEWRDHANNRIVLIWGAASRSTCLTLGELESTRAYTQCVCTDSEACCPWIWVDENAKPSGSANGQVLLYAVIGAATGSVLLLGAVVVVGRRTALKQEVVRRRLQGIDQGSTSQRLELEEQLRDLDRRSKLFGQRWTRMSLFAPSEGAIGAALSEPSGKEAQDLGNTDSGKDKDRRSAGRRAAAKSRGAGALGGKRGRSASGAKKRSGSSPGVRKRTGSAAGAAAAARRRKQAAGTPTIIVDLLYFIEDKGLDEEGVFRISGAKSAVAAILEAVRSNPSAGWSPSGAEDSVHAAASAVKQYMRELPGGLIPANMLEQVKDIVAAGETAEAAAALQPVLAKLPALNRDLLRRVTALAGMIAKFEEHNKMGVQQLATVFGPSMIPGDSLSHVSTAAMLVRICINHHDACFK